jgi:hypothetical protein
MKKYLITFDKAKAQFFLKAKHYNPDNTIKMIEEIAKLGKNQQEAEEKAFEITKEHLVYNPPAKVLNLKNGDAIFKEGPYKGKNVAETPILYIVERFIQTTYASKIKQADVDLMCAYDYLVKENPIKLHEFLKSYISKLEDTKVKHLFAKYENCINRKPIEFPYHTSQESVEYRLLGHILAPLTLEELKTRKLV